ncbi:nuclear transport factor 2 family protein [Kitasatospora sp. NBC_00458]|uniref:nuclear transport factor 2 family protein n=1 Tax=Kitasatospora sp. NBC_00458 TaxID=2903568 RepID=UPI002E19C38D
MAPTTHPQTEVRTGSGGRTDAALRYTEILELYARQAWQLDGFDADGFAATFTAGASFSHVSSGEVLVGPEAIAAAVRRVAERRAGAVHRHWFSQLLVEPAEEGAVPDSEGGAADGDAVRARYYAIVSVTGKDGAVAWDPSCVVEDVLVRRDGRWLTAERVVRRDDLLLR